MSGTQGFANIEAGTEIGGYRLEGLLGRGGMGAVYLAEQLSIGRKVAFKVLNPNRLRSPEKVEQFMREARIAAALQHRGLVAVHEVGTDPASGLHYYSMEYVHARTVHTAVNQDGPFAPERARHITLQCAEALAHAHRQLLIHRDIKPENILITTQNETKLADLGLAIDIVGPQSAAAAENSNRLLSVVGTPGWSAPEQLRNPLKTVPASDVFSLGAVFLYMLTGIEPYQGETLLDLTVRVCTEDPRGIEEIGRAEQELIRRLMAIDIDERPQNGEEAAALLRGGIPPETSNVRRRRPTRRRRR